MFATNKNTYGEHLLRNWFHGITMSTAAVRYFLHGLIPSWVDPPLCTPEKTDVTSTTTYDYDDNDEMVEFNPNTDPVNVL